MGHSSFLSITMTNSHWLWLCQENRNRDPFFGIIRIQAIFWRISALHPPLNHKTPKYGPGARSDQLQINLVEVIVYLPPWILANKQASMEVGRARYGEGSASDDTWLFHLIWPALPTLASLHKDYFRDYLQKSYPSPQLFLKVIWEMPKYTKWNQ